MQKTILTVAAATLFAGLAACGGGGTNAVAGVSSPTAASKITSADQVTQVATAISGSLNAFDSTPSGGFVVARAAPSKSARLGKSSVQTKAATRCSNGGTVSDDADSRTVYSSDGLTTFANCKETYTEAPVTSTSTTNGKVADQCTDTAQTANSCNAFAFKFADGATGGSDISLSSVVTGNSNSGDNEDSVITVRADVTESTSGSATTTTLSGGLGIVDNLSKDRFSVVFKNLRSVSTSSDNGHTESINGKFGVGSNKTKCSIGEVSLSTQTPLSFNNNDDIIAGKITVTDSSGGSATIEYNSNSSATVTLANGSTQVYSAAQLDSACD